MRKLFLAALFLLVCSGLVGLPDSADAKRHVARHIAAPQYNPKFAAFVVDGDTGKILYQENAGALRHPASLTKMMTLYLLFEALENNKVTMNTKLTASAYAAGRPKTNLNMQPGDTITVKEAILAIIVKSANDAATIVGESLGGTEEEFAKMMNKRAKQLGMKNSHFENACGLHDPKQITTAKDMALLGIALKKHFPEYFPFFSRTEFTYNGVNYKGHNHVMEMYPGADGLKTGFVNASGFNLVTTATRRGISLVGVVLGGRTHQSRDAQMMKLLDDGFQKAASIKNQPYVAADYQPKKAEEIPDDDDTGADDANQADEPVANVVAPQEAAPTPAAAPPAAKVVTIAPANDNAKAVSDNKPDDAIDQNESKSTKQVAQASTQLETYDNNTYVRSIAATKPTKSQRYKSNMLIQAAPLTGNASSPLFVPTPKPKPNL